MEQMYRREGFSSSPCSVAMVNSPLCSLLHELSINCQSLINWSPGLPLVKQQNGRLWIIYMPHILCFPVYKERYHALVKTHMMSLLSFLFSLLSSLLIFHHLLFSSLISPLLLYSILSSLLSSCLVSSVRSSSFPPIPSPLRTLLPPLMLLSSFSSFSSFSFLSSLSSQRVTVSTPLYSDVV